MAIEFIYKMRLKDVGEKKELFLGCTFIPQMGYIYLNSAHLSHDQNQWKELSENEH